MAKLFLESTDTSYKVSSNNTTVFGATGDQAVIIDGSLTGVVLDANVERVQFTGSTTDYKFKQVGTDLEIYNAAGALVTKVGLQDDTTGTQLTFANGTVKAAFAPSATGLGLTVGGVTVDKVAPTAATIAAANIDTSLASALLPSFSVTGAATATEGGNALFTVTLANPSATTATTVKYALTNLTTTTSADFGDEVVAGTNVTTAFDATLPAGTLTFAPGATTATITVPVTFDALTETGEGVTLTLSAPSAGIVSSTGTAVTTAFADAPAPTFTMTSSATAGISVQEGNTITFTVTPSGVVNAATVLNLNVVGAALGAISATTSATDFTTASAITFAAGETAAKTITVTVVNDGVTEGIEAYKAQLLDSSFNEKAAVQGTVADALPTLTLSQANATVNEGGVNTYTITSSAAAPAGGLTVPYTVAGTATSGTDYTAVTGTATILAGATTGTFTVTTIADRVTETAETLIVSLATTTGANLSTVAGATTATATILDTSTTPVAGAVTLSSSAATITETAGTNVVTYTVELGSAAPAGGVTIPYTLSGAATLTTDYTGASATTGNFTIAAGATTGTLVLTTVADVTTEAAAEAITITLGTLPAGYTLATGTTNTTTTTITDSSAAVSGSNFSLTTGIDSITGTAGNDIITGISGTGATSIAADVIDGGAGIDTFRNFTDGTIVFPGVMTSIEKLLINDSTAHESRDLTTGTMVSAGITDLTIQNGTTIDGSTVTVTMGSGQSTLTLDGITDADAGAATVADGGIAWTTASATTSGTLTINNLGASTVNTALTVGVTTANMTTLNVVATGTNYINLLNAGAGLTTLNISGAGTVTDYTALTAGITTVNASTATGAITLDHATNAAVVSITGGSGNDTFTLGANFVGAENATVANRDTINGGAGTDTLSITSAIASSAAATSVAQTTVTNIETISISDPSAADVDLTKFVGATTLKFASTVGAKTYTFNSGSTVEFITGDSGDNARSYVISGSGTTDALTLKGVAATDTGTGLQTFAGVETLNISTGTTAGTLMEIGGALTITPTAGIAGGSIVATGVNALTFTGIVTATSIDASALTGIVTLSATPANALTLRGGTKGDALLGSTGNDAIYGNDGADTITAGAGSDSIVLTETTSAIDKVVFSGNTTLSTQLTANGVDIITGFTASDLINVAALGDGAVSGGMTAVTGAGAAASTLTNDKAIVVSATGLAGGLTTSGTAVVTDWTNMTQVAAYITERFTVTDSTNSNVVVFNNTSGSNDTTYVYSMIDAGTTGLANTEIQLMGTITHTAGTALTADNVVYA